mmetsp:Transcript_26240/g.62395  ORF Transcript_26240/g.62395 Transcript_26240/m.62395 type:complete len:207 (-) Transcript_26240:713-1333(-)
MVVDQQRCLPVRAPCDGGPVPPRRLREGKAGVPWPAAQRVHAVAGGAPRQLRVCPIRGPNLIREPCQPHLDRDMLLHQPAGLTSSRGLPCSLWRETCPLSLPFSLKISSIPRDIPVTPLPPSVLPTRTPLTLPPLPHLSLPPELLSLWNGAAAAACPRQLMDPCAGTHVQFKARSALWAASGGGHGSAAPLPQHHPSPLSPRGATY